MKRTVVLTLMLSVLVLAQMALSAGAAQPDGDVLVETFRHTPEATDRLQVLRRAVHLLRAMDEAYPKALTRYALLHAAARSTEERGLILSGLSKVQHPAALRLLAPYANDEELREEALGAIRRIAGSLGIDPAAVLRDLRDKDMDSAGFVSIFDGESLDGWRGDPVLWRIQDGHIIGETRLDDPLKHNSFLIRDALESDFELRFRYRIDSASANSGVQIRSEEFAPYRVRGYQPDIATDDWITGICYEEGGRGILARRGQRVHLTREGERNTQRFAQEDDLGAHIRTSDWNDYHVIALGNRLLTLINGRLMHEIIDDAPQARKSGIIAFQLHTGRPMMLRFKDIRLRRLVSQSDWDTKSAAVPVIYDTDIDSDVDDVGALAVLHALANRGEANILAVIATTEDVDGPACVAAINTYFHRPNIPIGVNKEARPDPSLPGWLHLRSGFSRYARTIAAEYPHTLEGYSHAECATALYRRMLSSQPDNSVIIVTVGHLTNLKNLLLSTPDEHSPLDGIALVRRKVKLWSCMGGRYPRGKEANFYRPHPESTVVSVSNWPTTVVFSGWELGRDIITGGESFRQKAAKDSPVRRAYELYNNFAGRHSWDQTSVLYAVRGTDEDTLWSVQWDGSNHVFPDGSNEWRTSPHNENHGYLVAKMAPERIAEILEQLMLQEPMN